MDFEDAIEPVTILKTKSAELIRKVRRTHQPVIITQNGRATAVLQDIESFERQRKAILLLKWLAQGEEDLRKGRVVSHKHVVAHFSKKFDGLKHHGKKI